jgi:transposase InsO family protein
VLKTIKRAEDRYWFPGMNTYLSQKVRECVLCMAHKDNTPTIKQPLGKLPDPSAPWDRVHMDVWTVHGPTARSLPRGTPTSVIAFVDAFSKFLVAVPVANHTAETLVDVVIKYLINPLGIPRTIVSDGAPEFVGKLQQQLFRLLGITRKVVTPYRPQANGNIERVFRTIRPMTATIAAEDRTKWYLFLPFVIYAYNTSYHETIKDTPFHAMYGRDANPLIELGEELGEKERANIESVRHKATRARELLAQHLEESHEKNKNYYDQQMRPYEYSQDDFVMLRVLKIPREEARKLAPRYVGPYRIKEIRGRTIGVVPLQYPHNTPRFIHSDHSKPCGKDMVPNFSLETLLLPFESPAALDPNLEEELPE